MSELLLTIDTCGTSGSVAIARMFGERAEVLVQAELAGKTYSTVLVARIREALAGAVPDVVAVVSGPGSFTGVRIGVSAAKALAEAWNKPLIAVSRLAVLARKAGTSCALLDAGRGEFYFGSYGPHPREFLASEEQVREELAHSSGPPAALDDLSPIAGDLRTIRVRALTAMDALPLILERLRTGRFDDAATLDGNYLRRSDAELFAYRRPGPQITVQQD